MHKNYYREKNLTFEKRNDELVALYIKGVMLEKNMKNMKKYSTFNVFSVLIGESL